MVSKKVFENASADATLVLKNLREASNLYSIKQIIELDKTDPLKLDKCIFKVRNNNTSEMLPDCSLKRSMLNTSSLNNGSILNEFND